MSKKKQKGKAASKTAKSQQAGQKPVKLQDVLRSPLIRYFGIFAIIMIAFYVVWFQDFFKEGIVYPWNTFNARLSSFILNIFGSGTTAHGMLINGKDISISIKEGCDAIEPAMLFASAVIAFPAAWKKKLRGIGIGLLILFAINLVRIISLFLIERYWPQAFDFMHIQFWQVVFIGLAVVLWVLWMRSTSSNA